MSPQKVPLCHPFLSKVTSVLTSVTVDECCPLLHIIYTQTHVCVWSLSFSVFEVHAVGFSGGLSFLFPSCILLREYSTYGYKWVKLSWFLFGAIMNKAAMHILVQVLLWVLACTPEKWKH